MRRGAANYNGQLSLPGVGKLGARIARGKGRRGGNPETGLMAAHLDLAALHPRELRLFRVNSGGVKTASGGFFRAAPEGTSDLLGWAYAPKRFLAVEIKLRGAKLTPKQIQFGRDVVAGGGWFFVSYDVAEFWGAFQSALRDGYSPPAEITE